MAPSDNDTVCVAIFSRGIARIPHLKAFLRADRVLFRPSDNDAPDIHIVAGWGGKPNTQAAQAFARRHNKPFWRLEDGFLRSVGLGVDGHPPLSMIIDRTGVYYDATEPSDLETMLNGNADGATALDNDALVQRARRCIDQIITHRLSKYNNSPPENKALHKTDDRPRVLVIDQTAGDMSIQKGMLHPKGFDEMLRAAISENPDAEILVKIHPDVLAGKKKGHLTNTPAAPGIRIISDPINPLDLLSQVDRVYTGTSQMGFEALMMGKPVTCFGVPFYAGWGLTDDRVPIPRRTRTRTLEEVFAAAYILYPRYIHPDTGAPGQIEDVIEHLTLQRTMFEQNQGTIACVGISAWKRNYARRYLRCPGNRVLFFRSPEQATRADLGNTPRFLVWGFRDRGNLAKTAAHRGIPIWRMEDGFLRSIGIGSDLTAPASLVVDRRGMYYDPEHPSDLENLLLHHQFTDEETSRARRLREMIVDLKVSKYNVDGQEQLRSLAQPGQTIILVPGQVEDDESIRRGTVDICTNRALLEQVRRDNPDAHIIFKPHPDVVSGNRMGTIPDSLARTLANQVVEDASIANCLDMADQVHTMTSLVGFEGLIRGMGVTVYGRPFYGGWGLTRDRHPVPRRIRTLTLDQLVAGVLSQYPMYINPDTLAFTTPEIIVLKLQQKRDAHRKPLGTKMWWPARQLRKLMHLIKGLLDAR